MAVFPLAPVGALCELIGGGTPTSTNSDYWADEGATPWVSVADMSTTDRVHSTKKTVTDAGIESARLKVGEPDTVLFAMYASVGKYSVLGIKATWNQAILGLKPKSEQQLFWKYLFYSLETIQPILPTLYRSTTQNNLNAEQVSQIRIPLPDLDTQRRIADYLDKETAQIDTLVEELDGYVELLEKRFKTYSSDLLNSQSTEKSPLFTWGSIQSGDVISRDDISETGEYPVYGGNGLRGYAPTFNQNDDKILIGRQGALCGNIHLAEAPFFASEHALVFTPGKEVNLKWLEFVLDDLNLGNLSQASAQPGINGGEVIRQRIPQVSLLEQNRLEEELTKEREKSDTLIKECRELKEILLKRRQVLITDVVTGKVEV